MRPRRRASALVRQPWNVLVPLVFLQWLLLLLLTRRIEHNRWLFTQDGAGTYFWSTAWSLAHGHLPPPLVGFGWPLLLAPFAAVRGANYLDALPVLVLLQTLVVLPLTVAAVYGVASRIGGRWLGYVSAAGWVLIPYFAVAISSGSYRPAFEGTLLPQGLGLTGAGGVPGTACVLAAAYFAVAAIDSGEDAHAAIGGLLAGVAIAIDASNALFLFAPAAAYALARRGRTALVFGGAVLPGIVALALWQSRGLGHVPHVEASIDLHRLELLRQGFRDAFYSDRLAEAAFVAGVLGVARRSLPKSAFVAGWFLPYLLVRGSAAGASFGTGGWFGALMPAFPAFVIAVCSLPLLVPRLGERLSRAREPAALGRFGRAERWLGAGAVAVAVVTILVLAALPLQKQPVLLASPADLALVPVVKSLTPATGTKPGTVYLQWPAAKTPAGAAPFYVVYRSPATVPDGVGCERDGAARCVLGMQRLGSTVSPSYSDIAPPVPAGDWTYRIGLAANSAADVGGSGLVLLSPPVHVAVPSG
jgi:hypothetical protein